MSLTAIEHPAPLELLNAQRYLTSDEVASILNVPKSTVYEAAKQKRIGGTIRFGRKIRFDPRKFQEWLDGGGESLPGGWRQEAQ